MFTSPAIWNRNRNGNSPVRSRIPLWCLLVLMLITIVAFFPSLTNDYQREWDDQWMVLEHPMPMDQSAENIWYYLTHFDRGQYFPFNQLYYIGLYQLFGFNSMAYHIGSLILHLVNVVLVFGLIWKLSGWLGKGLSPGYKMMAATLVSVLFAVHPLQVEAVAWISASKVLWYGLIAGIAAYLVGFVVYSNVLTRKWENSETIKAEVREYLHPAIIKED